MNENAPVAPVLNAPPDALGEKNTFSLIDLLIILAKRKKSILLVPLVVAIVAVALSLVLPNIYRATTKLLPPQQAQSGAAALLSQLGGAAGAVAGAAAGLKNPNDVYVAMLKSRTVADKLIKQYDLLKDYDTESAERARMLLENNTVINSGKDGLITISVDSKDKEKVARIANSYVDELTNLTKVLAVTEAAQRRLFFERQLEMTKDNLAAAEMKLKGAIDTTGVISVDSESRAVVETVGILRARISSKEIELGSIKAFVTPNNPQYKQVQEELASLRAEMARLENGRPDAAASPNANKPGLQNIKLLRDVKYHQMLYELLAKQYEAARLDEAKDSAVIQVLDRAIEPERKAKPARAVIVITATMLALFAAIAWAFMAEARERASRDPARAAQMKALKANLRFR